MAQTPSSFHIHFHWQNLECGRRENKVPTNNSIKPFDTTIFHVSCNFSKRWWLSYRRILCAEPQAHLARRSGERSHEDIVGGGFAVHNSPRDNPVHEFGHTRQQSEMLFSSVFLTHREKCRDSASKIILNMSSSSRSELKPAYTFGGFLLDNKVAIKCRC